MSTLLIKEKKRKPREEKEVGTSSKSADRAVYIRSANNLNPLCFDRRLEMRRKEELRKWMTGRFRRQAVS